MILQTTLSMAAAAALITLWHIFRIGRIRQAEGITVGDGGNLALIKRMRAQANFVESTPFVLILVAAIEIAEKGGTWLAIVGAVFMLSRVVQPIGMDADKVQWGRVTGILVSMLVLPGLAIVAVLITLGIF